jgi:hypothetical protein
MGATFVLEIKSDKCTFPFIRKYTTPACTASDASQDLNGGNVGCFGITTRYSLMGEGVLYCNLASWMGRGTGSSQLSFSSHKRCMSILALMMNHRSWQYKGWSMGCLVTYLWNTDYVCEYNCMYKLHPCSSFSLCSMLNKFICFCLLAIPAMCSCRHVLNKIGEWSEN